MSKLTGLFENRLIPILCCVMAITFFALDLAVLGEVTSIPIFFLVCAVVTECVRGIFAYKLGRGWNGKIGRLQSPVQDPIE